MSESRPSLAVAVLFEREQQPNRWEEWRHRPVEVVVDAGQFGGAESNGPLPSTGHLGTRPQPRLLRDDGRLAQWLFSGLDLTLFRDECEGYYLNLTSGAPVWFVMWRMDEADPAQAWPEAVSLSYNEAGRWLDAQERVDNVPLPVELIAWLQAYTDTYYRPEPKQRKRPASFQSPDRR